MQIEEMKQEDLIDTNSFFLKILLTSEGDNIYNQLSTATTGKNGIGKKVNILTQQYVEEIYCKLMTLVKQNPDEYMRDLDNIKNIHLSKRHSLTSDDNHVAASVELEKSDSVRVSQEQQESAKNHVFKDEIIRIQKPIADLNEGSNDLACVDEDEEDLSSLKQKANGKSLNLECDNEESINLNVKDEDQNKLGPKASLEEDHKLSFYKIKKNRILKEFINILRTIDS
jgi:hypothetical protein